MARPVRRLWSVHTVVRRRHRTWMFSMSMASLGWAVWWATFVLRRFAPDLAPHLLVTEWLAGACAAVGLLASFWCFRAKLAWLLITSIAVFANGSLLAMPWVVEVVRSERAAARTSDGAATHATIEPRSGARAITPADDRPTGS